jgi:hypothetical protein
LPTASIFTESSKEIFPTEWYSASKLGPQVSPFPVPIFGVNSIYKKEKTEEKKKYERKRKEKEKGK